MHILPLINIKTFLIGFIANSVAHPASKHHLIAFHEIIHDVLQLGHEGLPIYQVKVDDLGRGDLDPLVAFDEVDEASHFYLMVLLPAPLLG